MSFQQRFNELRLRAGLSQADVARGVGVTQTCVSNWSNGNTEPRSDKMPRIAQVLRSSISELSGFGHVNEYERSPQVSNLERKISVEDVLHRTRDEVAVLLGVASSKVTVSFSVAV